MSSIYSHSRGTEGAHLGDTGKHKSHKFMVRDFCCSLGSDQTFSCLTIFIFISHTYLLNLQAFSFTCAVFFIYKFPTLALSICLLVFNTESFFLCYPGWCGTDFVTQSDGKHLASLWDSGCAPLCLVNTVFCLFVCLFCYLVWWGLFCSLLFWAFLFLFSLALPLPKGEWKETTPGKWPWSRLHTQEGMLCLLLVVCGALQVKETSPVINYVNDPWKDSVNVVF